MKKSKRYIILGTTAVVSIFLLLIATIYVAVYVKDSSSQLAQNAKKTFHLPVASVNGEKLHFTTLEKRTDAVRYFYEHQDFASAGIRIDFATDEGHKRLHIIEKEVLNKMIEEQVLEELAVAQGISLSDEEVEMSLKRAMDQTDRDFAQERIGLYGLTEEEFAQNIVRGELYSEKLQANYYRTEPVTAEMRAKMKEAQDEILAGEKFEDIARKYSEGITAKDGGALDFFTKGQLIEEVENVAFAMEKESVSDIIESPLGLHIIFVDDVKKDAAGETEMVSLHQIILKRPTFAQYLDDAVRKAEIKIFTPQYTWDTRQAQLLFTDPSMRQFAQEVKQDVEEKLAS